MLGSYFGLPVSSTHCNVGSLLGIVFAEKFNAVKIVYHEEKVKEENKLNKKVMFKIFGWWLITVPVVLVGTVLFSYSII
jgi:phosphate/sulfate permease